MPQTQEQAKTPVRRYLNTCDGTIALVFLLIAAARLVYVSLYASPLPFWDQWDELDHIFMPWRDGTLQWMQLFAAHNEHRIALTRILGLILFVFNGHKFDNLVESDFNALIYAGMWTLAYALMVRGETSRVRRLVLAISIAALGVLPYDWENTLVGFQSQFYLMEIAAITLIGVASYCAPTGATLLTLLLLGAIGLFTMAAGVLAIPATCLVVALLAWRNRSQAIYSLLACTFLACLTAIGLAAIPHVAGDDAFKSQGIVEHVRALLVALVWPMQELSLRTLAFGTLIWTPTTAWAWRYLRSRQATDREIFTIGICGWVLLQFLAIAHARGHGMSSLSSRYTEIAALGIAANIWLALQSMPSMRKQRTAASFAIAAGICLIAYAFHLRTPGDYAAMVQRHEFGSIQARNIRRYLQGEAFPPVPDGSLALPYPNSSRLQSLLHMPDILSMLTAAALPNHGSNSSPSRYALKLQIMVRKWFVDHGREPGRTQFSLATMEPPANASSTFCALDQITINGINIAKRSVSAHKNSLLGLTGWIVDYRRTAPSYFTIELASNTEKSYVSEANAGLTRPDVARALQSDSALDSGYSVIAKMNNVLPGSYQIVLVVHAPDRTSICDTRRTLNILPN